MNLKVQPMGLFVSIDDIKCYFRKQLENIYDQAASNTVF